MSNAQVISLPLAGAASRRIHNPVQRDAATFLETSAETDGARTLVELEVSPGGRVNPHEHTTYTEYFAVHRGRLTVRVDDAEVHLGPGDEAIVPAGAVHSWANETPDRAVAVVELRPGHPGFEKALRVAYGLAADGRVTAKGRPRNPLHTALLLDWSDGRLAGASSLLTRPMALLARLARAVSAVRVLLTTSGAAGHFLPLVPFARACLTAGHDVRVAAQRSRGAIVGRAGLAFVPFDDRPPEQWGRVMSTLGTLSSDEANVRIVSEVFGRIDTRTALPGLLETIEAWRPDVVLSESTEFAGALAAELHNLPHARVPLGVLAVEDWALGVTADALDDVRAGVGLPADPGARRLRAAPRLTNVPRGLDDVPADWPSTVHRFAGEPARAAAPLPDWWEDASDPLVYVTFGSVAAALSYFPSLYRATIDALAGLPVRLLVTIGNDRDPAELGAVPANVHVERWVPQEAVAHHAAAVVCHGGYGTTLGALGQGLPLVVVPLQSADQWHNAPRR